MKRDAQIRGKNQVHYNKVCQLRVNESVYCAGWKIQYSANTVHSQGESNMLSNTLCQFPSFLHINIKGNVAMYVSLWQG